jgi:aryl-alcohol dehydrogenase-like predicted oxidoreductase
MYHHFPDYEARSVMTELQHLKATRAIQKVGVSLYEVDQLAKVVDDSDIDIIQLPANLLDLSQTKINLLGRAKEKGKEIHIRSVYLQGLFFKDLDSLEGNLIRMRPYLEKIDAISRQHATDKKKGALNFIIQKEYVDYVVLGIDRVSQLIENISLLDQSYETSIFEGINVKPEDAYLLNPANWKL